MKIAFIGQKGIPARKGGVEAHVWRLSARLAALGHDVTVYARPYFMENRECRCDGVRIVTVPGIRTKHLDAITHTLAATAHALFGGYDVIHYQSIGPSSLSIVPRLFLRNTLIVSTFHARDYYRGKWGAFARAFLRGAERIACTVPHRTIVVSRGMESYARKKYGRDIAYVPNGAEAVPAASDDMIAAFGLREKRYVLAVTKLVAHRGVHHLIRAFLELEDTGRLQNNFKLAIVGTHAETPGYERHLRRMCEGRESVLFLGEQSGESLAELYTDAALFVQPAEDGGLAVELLEAMSYGLPIVASRIPGNEEALGDAGAYFDAADTESLRAELARLLNRPDEMARFGMMAKRRAEECYGWDAIARQTAELYETGLDRLRNRTN